MQNRSGRARSGPCPVDREIRGLEWNDCEPWWTSSVGDPVGPWMLGDTGGPGAWSVPNLPPLRGWNTAPSARGPRSQGTPEGREPGAFVQRGNSSNGSDRFQLFCTRTRVRRRESRSLLPARSRSSCGGARSTPGLYWPAGRNLRVQGWRCVEENEIYAWLSGLPHLCQARRRGRRRAVTIHNRAN